MDELINCKEKAPQKVVLAGLFCGEDEDFDSSEETLAELSSLCKTAGGVPVCTVLQNRPSPDPKTLIGSGKAEELSNFVRENEADLVVFDNDLSPIQIRNLEQAVGVRVIDRSMLILDIFSLHAHTYDGRLQVELAQLKYTMPRLIGAGNELSRLGGGIGTRGPGETLLETQRRYYRQRMAALSHQLRELKKNRSIQRKKRDESGISKVALMGYTNAGKSTLLNALTGAGVLAEDKLFATLDPTTRKLDLGDGQQALITDTVGFIRKLPHHLIEAFSSTLEEVACADLLIHVIDVSNPEWPAHRKVAEELAFKLGAAGKPIVTAFNKADCAYINDALFDIPDSVFISAKHKKGLDELINAVRKKLIESARNVKLRLPYPDASLLDALYRDAKVSFVEYREDGIHIRAFLKPELFGRLRDFIKREEPDDGL